MLAASITFSRGPRRPMPRGRERSMSYRFTTKIFGLIVAAGLVAAACGGGATAAPTPAASTQATASAAAGTLPAPELTTIRIGISAPTEPVQYAEKLAD